MMRIADVDMRERFGPELMAQYLTAKGFKLVGPFAEYSNIWRHADYPDREILLPHTTIIDDYNEVMDRVMENLNDMGCYEMGRDLLTELELTRQVCVLDRIEYTLAKYKMSQTLDMDGE